MELLDEHLKTIRTEIANQIKLERPAGRLARLLADLEDEAERRRATDAAFGESVRAALDGDAKTSPVESFLARPTPVGLDQRAHLPRSLRAPTDEEAARGVVVAYRVANFTVYRAVVDRLQAGEMFRMETERSAYEIPAEEFDRAFPGIARSQSYRIGSPKALGSARYVVGKPPAAADAFRVAT